MLLNRISTNMHRDETGSVSLLLLTVVSMTLLLAAPLLYLSSMICMQMKLVNTADLVALGGATEFLLDRPNQCQVAKTLATRNKVTLLECQVEDLSVSVTVGVGAPNLIVQLGVDTLTARAKAGL